MRGDGMDDDDYVEVPAFVRMPKDAQLAGSRKTEGYFRGFTPKSSEKGPEHVEIRLTSQEDVSSYEPDDTETVYAHEPPQRIEWTPEEIQAAAENIAWALAKVVGAVRWAQPRVQRLVDERMAPALRAQLEHLRGWKLKRDAADRPTASATAAGMEILPAEEASKAVSDKQGSERIRMSSDEARAHLVALLMAEELAERVRTLLASALISDDVPPEITTAVRELTPEQMAKALGSALAAEPNLLHDLLERLGAPDVRGQIESDNGGATSVQMASD